MTVLATSRLRVLLAAALLLPLTAAGCATAQTAATEGEEATVQTPAMDAPFRLGIGEAARIDGHTVTFGAVTEDSRCPEGVDCIRAGEARIQVEVDGEAVVLTIPAAMARDGDTAVVRVGGVLLEATDLLPYPGSAADEAEEPIQAVFVVTAG